MTDQEIQEIREVVEDTVGFFIDCKESFTSLDISNDVKENTLPWVRHSEVAEQIRILYQEDFWGIKSGYKRTIIDVYLSNGTSATAYLYHSEDSSPDDYNNRNQTAVAPKPKTIDSNLTTNNWPPQATVGSQNLTLPATYGATTGSQAASFGTTKDSRFTNSTTSRPINRPINNSNNNKSPNGRPADDSAIVWGEVKSDGRLEIPAKFVRMLGWCPGKQIYIKLTYCSLCLSCNPSSFNNIFFTATTITPDGRLRVPKTALAKADFDTSEPLAIYISNKCIVVSESQEP
jgi:hypothetical protein